MFFEQMNLPIVCITSIGYGDQAPKTQLGKIVTVLYVIIGFPLMVICWSNTGAVMADCFRFIYWRICCIVCVNSSNFPMSPNNQYLMTSSRASRGTVTLRHLSPTTAGGQSIQTLSTTTLGSKFPIKSPR